MDIARFPGKSNAPRCADIRSHQSIPELCQQDCQQDCQHDNMWQWFNGNIYCTSLSMWQSGYMDSTSSDIQCFSSASRDLKMQCKSTWTPGTFDSVPRVCVQCKVTMNSWRLHLPSTPLDSTTKSSCENLCPVSCLKRKQRWMTYSHLGTIHT